MKKVFSIFLFLFISIGTIIAQDTTTVTATSDDISEDLDLEAVASIFGDSKDLEDFEKRLNDPESKISNLDLNKDGEVDYLRVVDNSKGDTKTAAVQAVLGKDKYQDVAVIDIVKDKKGETTVQVVGDVYMYGEAYIVQPVYVTPPVIVTWFWAPIYSPWHSPYYWGYYPPYFNPWRVMARTAYRHHIYNHHGHYNNHYNHTSNRISHNSVTINNNVRRNDYARSNPNNSFEKRNKGVSNKSGLNKSNRATTTNKKAKPSTTNKKNYKSTGRKTQNNWKSPSNKRTHTRPSNNYNKTRSSNNRQSRPQTRPSSSYSRPSPARTRSTPSVGGRRR